MRVLGKDQVQDVLRHCDATYFSVQSSNVWKYGLSLNKIQDYMVAGKPILSSYTGYPTMIDEAGAGLSAPAGDAVALRARILELAAMSSAEREAMGRRGREWLIAKRSYRALAQDYLDVALPYRAAA